MPKIARDQKLVAFPRTSLPVLEELKIALYRAGRSEKVASGKAALAYAVQDTLDRLERDAANQAQKVS